MRVSRPLQATVIAVALMLPTPGIAYADEGPFRNENQPVESNINSASNSVYDVETSYRYIGDYADSTFQPMNVTRVARFIGRVDAHHAHKSGSEVSGHVSWTLISGARRKMEVKSTLKAKTGWFGYSTKASSRKKSVWPGGGRGKAAVARYRCRGTKITKWYTYGEGFAPGTQKPWGYHNGKVVKLPCGA